MFFKFVFLLYYINPNHCTNRFICHKMDTVIPQYNAVPIVKKLFAPCCFLWYSLNIDKQNIRWYHKDKVFLM